MGTTAYRVTLVPDLRSAWSAVAGCLKPGIFLVHFFFTFFQHSPSRTRDGWVVGNVRGAAGLFAGSLLWNARE